MPLFIHESALDRDLANALAKMEQDGLVVIEGERVTLTEKGLRHAADRQERIVQ